MQSFVLLVFAIGFFVNYMLMLIYPRIYRLFRDDKVFFISLFPSLLLSLIAFEMYDEESIKDDWHLLSWFYVPIVFLFVYKLVDLYFLNVYKRHFVFKISSKLDALIKPDEEEKNQGWLELFISFFFFFLPFLIMLAINKIVGLS